MDIIFNSSRRDFCKKEQRFIPHQFQTKTNLSTHPDPSYGLRGEKYFSFSMSFALHLSPCTEKAPKKV